MNSPLFVNFVDFRKAFDSTQRDSHQVVLWTIRVRRDSEVRRFGFLRVPNGDETGMYAFTTTFPHPRRLRNKNSQRKIMRRHTVDFFRSSWIRRWPWFGRWSGFWRALKLRFEKRPKMYANCDACGAINQCTENESDVYQHHFRCTSHDRGRKAWMRMQLYIPWNCDK